MLREVPVKFQRIYRRAMTGKSRKAAMHAFCLECCYWQIREVQLCGDTGCPLFPYRPRARVLPERSNARTNGAELANGVSQARFTGKCRVQPK